MRVHAMANCACLCLARWPLAIATTSIYFLIIVSILSSTVSAGYCNCFVFVARLFSFPSW